MTEKSLSMNSALGDSFQISLNASAEQKLAVDQGIQTCIIWTAGTLVYVNLYGNADATKMLLPASVLFPVPVENLKDISIYNDDTGAAIVYVMWRAR